MNITVKQLKELLELEPDDAVILCMYKDSNGDYQHQPVYKTVTTTDDSEVLLYVSSP